MKKILAIFLILYFYIKRISAILRKRQRYKKELFDKALLEGKVVIVSSWIKYCTSCASQMKISK
jgi:thioredoxin 1